MKLLVYSYRQRQATGVQGDTLTSESAQPNLYYYISKQQVIILRRPLTGRVIGPSRAGYNSCGTQPVTCDLLSDLAPSPPS